MKEQIGSSQKSMFDTILENDGRKKSWVQTLLESTPVIFREMCPSAFLSSYAKLGLVLFPSFETAGGNHEWDVPLNQADCP